MTIKTLLSVSRALIIPMSVAAVGIPATGMLAGCDETIEKREKVETKRDGTVVHEQEKTERKPDGTIEKTEKKTVDR
jgi:hypothetical protein